MTNTVSACYMQTRNTSRSIKAKLVQGNGFDECVTSGLTAAFACHGR